MPRRKHISAAVNDDGNEGACVCVRAHPQWLIPNSADFVSRRENDVKAIRGSCGGRNASLHLRETRAKVPLIRLPDIFGQRFGLN